VLNPLLSAHYKKITCPNVVNCAVKLQIFVFVHIFKTGLPHDFSPSILCCCNKQINLYQLKAINLHKIKHSCLIVSNIRGLTLCWRVQGMYNVGFLFGHDQKVIEIYSTIWMPTLRNIKLCIFKKGGIKDRK
jgi:hypothetical protein